VARRWVIAVNTWTNAGSRETAVDWMFRSTDGKRTQKFWSR
jgi:hypothetical protein